jgi:virulence-associated protein VapD
VLRINPNYDKIPDEKHLFDVINLLNNAGYKGITQTVYLNKNDILQIHTNKKLKNFSSRIQKHLVRVKKLLSNK